MRKSLMVVLLTLFGSGWSIHSARSGDIPRLETGIAVVDITPPIPYRMSGYFNERLSTGIKDRLKARAIVFRQGNTQAALVFCDLVGMSPRISAQARKRAGRATGIPVSHIAVAATHSHTGPLYFGALRRHFHDKAVAEHGRDRYEVIDYPALLENRIVQSIRLAQSALKPVSLQSGSAREERLSFNRRFFLKDGSVRFNPGQRNPNIVRVAGPIDPEVGLVRITARDGRTIGLLTSFALHLDTVGGTEYSADYPKFLGDHLRRKFGTNFVSLFGTGTCGDINHVDVTIRGRRSAREIGTMLAETVERALSDLQPIVQPALAVRRAVVTVLLQQYSSERVAAARKLMDRVADRKVPFLKRVEAYKIMALELRGGKAIDLEVQVFRLGADLAVVTLPGEVFVDLGLAIKRASPFRTTLIVELTNDTPGYIPTKKAFAEGSYETVNSRIQSGGGEKMAAAAIRLLKDLRKPAR